MSNKLQEHEKTIKKQYLHDFVSLKTNPHMAKSNVVCKFAESSAIKWSFLSKSSVSNKPICGTW